MNEQQYPELELINTTELMCSENYKERLAAEIIQLEIRIRKLEKAVRGLLMDELDFTPGSPSSLLMTQLETMKDYAFQLDLRAMLEGVDIKAIRRELEIEKIARA